MKPTQQDIVDLARKAHHELVTIDYPGHIAPLDPWTMRLCERLVHLALERYGAGGGEPVVAAVFDALLGRPVLVEDAPMLAPGQELYTLPSPTDLRAEYLRGLEDAKKACESWANQHSSASGGCTHVDCDFMAAALDCAEAIEALKGK